MAAERCPLSLQDRENVWKGCWKKNPRYLGHVPDQYKTEEMCNKAVACIAPYKLGLVPDNYFKALMKQRIEMCSRITCYRLCVIFFVPNCFKTQMSKKTVCMDPYSLEFVPGHLKTQEICDEAVHREPYTLRYVPDHLKTQEMCHEAVGRDSCSLETVRREPYTLRYVHGPCLLRYVPDHLITQEAYRGVVEKNIWPSDMLRLKMY